MRELVYFVAASLDGFIANEHGGHDGFCVDENYLGELFSEYPETLPSHLHKVFGVTPQCRHFDTVLMGRATYEVGVRDGVTSPYQHLKQYLFSSTLDDSPSSEVMLIKENVEDMVQQLKQQDGAGIWLCGGGVLASALLRHGLIDRLMIKINPFLMGKGVPLFAPDDAMRVALRHLDSRSFSGGVNLQHYRVDYD